MKFSFQIFKDDTISCFKGFTQIEYNDPVNSFTNRVDEYSQVNDIIERLRTANRDITNELKNIAKDLESIIESKIMSPEEVKKNTIFN